MTTYIIHHRWQGMLYPEPIEADSPEKAYEIYANDPGDFATSDDEPFNRDDLVIEIGSKYYIYSDDGQQTIFAHSFEAAAEIAGAPDDDLIADGAWMVIRDEATMESIEYGNRPQ